MTNSARSTDTSFAIHTTCMDDAELQQVLPESDERFDNQSNLIFVEEPHDHDVLCGRGGSINSHPGNERFRQLVEKRKRVYLTARFKREKRLIANSILSEIRSIDPPGRFLSRDPKSGKWYDIGDEKARDKTSQALRENAPSIRAEIEVEINQKRAEMQRVEDEALMNMHQGPPHPYYQQPWGYYTPYHGYGQFHTEGPPIHYSHSEHYQQQWPTRYSERNASPAPPSRHRVRTERNSLQVLENVHPVGAPQEQSEGVVFDVPNFVSSVPSSLAAWTRTSFSFSGHSEHQEPFNSRITHQTPRPLSYNHDMSEQEHIDSRDGRRVVHFEEDRRSNSNYRLRSIDTGHNKDKKKFNCNSSSKFRPERLSENIEPRSQIESESSDSRKKVRRDQMSHSVDVAFEDAERESSLLSQVTNRILGSWEMNIGCTNRNPGKDVLVTQSDLSASNEHDPSCRIPPPISLVDAMEDDEGQEVELMDMMNFEDSMALADADDGICDDEHRTPPPREINNEVPQPRRIEIDWPSKMLGCQSNWLPETFNPPSFFSKSNPLSPSASLDMDTSAIGTEGISVTGSIGGASLCHVFSHDNEDNAIQPPCLTDEIQVLSQMPSWERSVRSKSPSTICSVPSIDPSQSIQEDCILHQ
jgi:hypothetical protein